MAKNADERCFWTDLVKKLQPCVTKENFPERTRRSLSLLFCSIFLAACGTLRTTTDKVAQIALDAVGVNTSQKSAANGSARTIRMHLDASRNLNADDNGNGLSAIVRLYKLKDINTFLAAPHSVFGHIEREKESFGADLMDVRELTLAPGQRLDLAEKMTDEMAYLGVVTLFRSPDRKRWRFAFGVAAAEATDITLGLHACAMTATSMAPSGMTLNDTALLSSVKCN
ncbi:type VI secretion system lipoprotein TssJ [Noviherbaspirillum autotrophicum]|uniref:type VI secretion system lipoprotein TssJ n=1 Tax=Noviherbaspirillum autotrophicum TaxID=709839 RepID=UPI0009FC9689|nr:type VI secretion system lipoprotein TssJ [Noviherbaspirillum autotrophicum]